MTDADILERIEAGTLFVDVTNALVYYQKSGRWFRFVVIERKIRGHGYRFVRINWKGLQKKISVHRLVWMYHTGEVVPAGYDVDHIDHKVSFPDGIGNLRLLKSSVNRGLPHVATNDPEELSKAQEARCRLR